MVLILTPNIDMSLAVKAKELYLIGNYDESLETFRQVQEQIQAYTSSLSDEMEAGDPSNFEAAEKIYSEWERVLTLLQEEFGLVRQIQDTCAMFRTAPGRPNIAPAAAMPVHEAQQFAPAAHQRSSSAAAASAAMTDAQLQAQHLAAQAATDVRDPDVWPPPTSEAPIRNKRVSSYGGGNPSQWAPAARAPARTPLKAAPLSRENSQDDGAGDQPSARLPDWANRKGPAAAPVAKPAPKLVRKVSSTPAAVVAQPTPIPEPVSKPKRASMAPMRKPAVPTAGRKASAAAAAPAGRKGSSAKEGDEPAEDGGRVKFEANNKEEQEMADMIEREILDKKPNVKMADIAGLGGAKQLLTEAIVLPRLIPGYFTGKRKPWRGVLMFGPPGTGKTLLAKAVATECATTFFNVSPSTVTSRFRGDSEKLMKLLFEMARFYAPSTIFMDEVDGLCSARGGSGEHEASRRVKGEILQQMDGATAGEYDPTKSVIVLGATNLPWELDTAFLRRFEKRVHIDLPDEEGRLAMFRINTEGMVVSDDASEGGTWKAMVELADGYSGADIAVVCNDASMLGLRRLLAGKTPDEMKNMDKSEFQVPITRADFESVFSTVKSSAGKNDLEKYREWMREFGSAI